MDRLKPQGPSGNIVFTILRADAIATPLPRTPGIKGAFTTDQSDRYDLTMEAMIQINIPGKTGRIQTRAFASQTVAENATLNEREAVWFQITEKAMKAINAEFEKQINASWRPFLLP